MASVFVIAEVKDNQYAVTTRPDQPHRIGLPGGKVDQGEGLRQALLREAWEEGFSLHGLSPQPFYQTTVEGKMVFWFTAKSATLLKKYKEQHRLTATTASLDVIKNSGFCNDIAVDVLQSGDCNLCALVQGYCGQC